MLPLPLKIKAMNTRKLNFKTSYIIVGVVFLILLIIFGNRMFLIIDAGERGVIFRPYTSGLDRDNIYGEGFHVVAPWNRMYVYNVRSSSGKRPWMCLTRAV